MNTIKRIALALLGMMLFTVSIGTAIVFADNNSNDVSENEETAEPTWSGTEPFPDYLKGDLNFDETIDATDASMILTYAADVGAGEKPYYMTTYIGDYNSDGKADATDASLILIYAAEQGAQS